MLGLIQMLLVVPKAWLAYRQPKRRVWHVVSGGVLLVLGFVMFRGGGGVE